MTYLSLDTRRCFARCADDRHDQVVEEAGARGSVHLHGFARALSSKGAESSRIPSATRYFGRASAIVVIHAMSRGGQLDGGSLGGRRESHMAVKYVSEFPRVEWRRASRFGNDDVEQTGPIGPTRAWDLDGVKAHEGTRILFVGEVVVLLSGLGLSGVHSIWVLNVVDSGLLALLGPFPPLGC